ncbi:MAG: PAS domain S-box protein [Polaromonas sp.]|uniref:PAS domain S-box protein n=1 Tax=Polaromonas sp. TaxID=1869339 RepID=UPI0027370E9B|nr:PAS domain S-box protein [Polaromonas sp.]MDP2819287.1 PAS domain S-box protein [Polaromonas sp.]
MKQTEQNPLKAQRLQDRVLTLTRLTDDLQQQLLRQAAQLQAYEWAAQQQQALQAQPAAGDAASEQQFTSAFENAAIGMSVLGTDSRRLRVNRAFCEMFGYSQAELMATGAPEVTHPDDMAEDILQRSRALAGEIETYQREKRYLHKSGGLVWAALTCSLVRDAQGRPLHFISQLQDITERKLAEQLSRANEERFRALVQLSTDWFWEQDENFRFVQISGELVDLGPLTSNSSIGKLRRELPYVNMDDSQWAAHEALLARREPFRDFEVTRLDSEGQVRHLSISGVPIFDAAGRFTGYRGTGRDTTSMRRSSDRVRASERQLREITDAVPALIAYVDAGQRCRFHNRAYQEAFGLRSEDILGKSMRELMEPAFYEALRPRVEEVLAGYPVVYERKQRSANGKVRDYVVNYFPRYGDGSDEGKVIGFYSLATDITELKRIDRLKSEFVSTVSHELRTPLTSIRGSLGLISGGIAGPLPDAAMKLVGIAKNNCERLIRLINDILDIEKIESGKMRLDLQPMALMPLLTQAIAANEGYGLANQVSLVLLGDEPELQVNVEADRLTQVVTNLLSNALKFSPPGGTVEVHVTRAGLGVRVEVRDHGPGIPEEFRTRIFQKFSQADSSDSRQKGGTGLGLNISHALVERMGGSIGFASRLGEGTTFFFELPLWRGPAEAAPLPPRSRILVCEADVDVARLIAIMLDKAGFESVLAHSAEQASALLTTGNYDAVTLDLRLPGQTGGAFLNSLRQNEATRALPVIVISTLAGDGQLQLDHKPSAVSDWLTKPIDEGQLVSAMQRAVAALHGRKPRILHVEDDVDIQHIAAAIAADFASFEFANNLTEARALLQGKPFDLVLLDLGLGSESGWDLVELIDSLQPRPALVVFSASEVLPDAGTRPDAVLVKASTSNADLLQTIQRVLKMPGDPAGGERAR